MNYLPIENYGIIGNLKTIALVGLNGSIDFMCYPEFDSASMFAALLDDEKGGKFQIQPVFTEMKSKQLYLPDTNVLLTRFLSKAGVGEITDFMPVDGSGGGNMLTRRVTTIRGNLCYRMLFQPRFNYARDLCQPILKSSTEVIYKGIDDKLLIRLVSSIPLNIEGNDVIADFSLSAKQTAGFLMHFDVMKIEKESLHSFVSDSLSKTAKYWKDWMAQSSYRGRWMESVNRSALVLKLLTNKKYGSIVAAPTFSLPESIESGRNWDYRYTWIRDASFTSYSLIRLGYIEEASAFMNWVEKICTDIKGQHTFGLMYKIDGSHLTDELILDIFEGYKKSSPLRIGNKAFGQTQLDIYGELMDAVYLLNKYGAPISYDFWKNLERQIDWLVNNWNQEDEVIWEVRGGKKKFLYSRVLSWVAIDRAIKIADFRSFPLNKNWRKERDIIYKSVYIDFWSEKNQAFMQYDGAETVDASALLMPLIRFISPKDPRWLSTLKKIEEDLVSDSLVFRYRTEIAAPDGFTSDEGTFSMCSFWYVECLSKSGQLEKATFYFEKMLGYANHLGLYSEQLGSEAEHLGNFPQAFTHLALISAA
jgi:GH15 family glucan-1,4-alpha-glucosidase